MTRPPAECVRVFTCRLVSPSSSMMGGQKIFSHAGTMSLHRPLGRHTSSLLPSRVLPLLHENVTRVFRMVWLVETSSPRVGMMEGQVTLSTRILIVVECLGGVVQVYWPVSSSVAWKILSLEKKQVEKSL